MPAALDIAQTTLAPVRDHCNSEQEADACLMVSIWYLAQEDTTRFDHYRAIGERYLAKDCEVGESPQCRFKVFYKEFTGLPIPPPQPPSGEIEVVPEQTVPTPQR